MAVGLTLLEATILEDINDDYYGLWEVDWFFNSMKLPPERSVRIEAVTSLVRAGFVELRYATWEKTRGDGVAPLTGDKALEIVADYGNWRAPPPDGPDDVYTVADTPAGAAASNAWWQNSGLVPGA